MVMDHLYDLIPDGHKVGESEINSYLCGVYLGLEQFVSVSETNDFSKQLYDTLKIKQLSKKKRPTAKNTH